MSDRVWGGALSPDDKCIKAQMDNIDALKKQLAALRDAVRDLAESCPDCDASSQEVEGHAPTCRVRKLMAALDAAKEK